MKTESSEKKLKEEEDDLKLEIEVSKYRYIYNKTPDDLSLESKEDMNSLRENTKNLKYEPKLAEVLLKR